MLCRRRLFFSLLNEKYIQNFKYSIKISEKPLGCIFFHPKVHYLMKKLTIVDYEKLFQPRKLGKPADSPQYTFMTDAELEREREKARNTARKLLQMPPLIDAVNEKIEILSNDPSLDGFDEHHSKFVFTDLSNDLEFYERSIVVREPNGLLRTANKNERFRMNQIFFPINGRNIDTPKMFEPENFQDLLARREYEFILDRACVQFNPEDENYHQVLISTFDYVNEKGEFDKLIKTRHFGPFALYLAVNNKIQNMLQFFLEIGDLEKASYLVDMHNIVQTKSPWSLADATDSDKDFNKAFSFDEACESLKSFIDHHSTPGSQLESYFFTAMQKYAEKEEEVKDEAVQAKGS